MVLRKKRQTRYWDGHERRSFTIFGGFITGPFRIYIRKKNFILLDSLSILIILITARVH